MTDTASGTIATTPADPPKPGIRTTEFWLTLLANTIGALMDGGVIGGGTEVAKIAGTALIVLATLGYQYHRTQLKAASS